MRRGLGRDKKEREGGRFLELRHMIEDLQREYCDSKGEYGCRNCDGLKELVTITVGGGAVYDRECLAEMGVTGKNVEEVLRSYAGLLEERICERMVSA